jgi:hypothetical protein
VNADFQTSVNMYGVIGPFFTIQLYERGIYSLLYIENTPYLLIRRSEFVNYVDSSQVGFAML